MGGEARVAGKERQKAKRPMEQPAQAPEVVAQQTAAALREGEASWLARLTENPLSFAAIEREVHATTRQQADRYVAGLMEKAGQQAAVAALVQQKIAAEAPRVRPPEKKSGR